MSKETGGTRGEKLRSPRPSATNLREARGVVVVAASGPDVEFVIPQYLLLVNRSH